MGEQKEAIILKSTSISKYRSSMMPMLCGTHRHTCVFPMVHWFNAMWDSVHDDLRRVCMYMCMQGARFRLSATEKHGDGDDDSSL